MGEKLNLIYRLHSFVYANVDSCECLLFNAEGVAEELMFQSATPEFISSSEINLNLIYIIIRR
jgi:hypothetical protein